MKHSKKYTDKMYKWYHSPEWRVPRNAYRSKRVSIDGGMCETCKDELGYIVDHIEELNEINFNDIDIRLNEDNLQYICIQCHNKKTFKKNKALEDGYTINDRGELEYTPHKK